MDTRALPRGPAPGGLGGGPLRRRPPRAEAGAGAAAVARRNERERNRVRLVNLGFQALRQHVPLGGAGRKPSKVETLRSAVDYIRALQRLLAEHDALRAALAGGLLAPAARAPAAPARAPAPPGRGAGSEPGSPRSAGSPGGSGGEGAPSPAERELLRLSAWLGGR